MRGATVCRPIGRTGLEVTALGRGGPPLGPRAAIPEPPEAKIGTARELGVHPCGTASLHGRDDDA